MTTPWKPVPLLTPAKTVTVWNHLTKTSHRGVPAARYVITYEDGRNCQIEDWEGVFPNATYAALAVHRFGPITILAVTRNGYPVFARYAGAHLEPAAR